MSLVPRKSRIDETNGFRGTNGKETSKNSELPFKENHKSKSQKGVGRKPNNRSSNKIKADINSRDFSAKSNMDQFTLDRINLRIVEELMTNGDIKSSEIAAKLKIPLSTIQRRRTRIEKSLLRKNYQMDLTLLGYRTAQIFVDIQGGRAKETGEALLKKYDRNIINASTRINSSNNLCLEVVYNGSEELHYLLEEIKSLPLATKVDWSERVMLIGDNLSSIIKNTLTDRLDQIQLTKIVV
ncbi:MAG TPA: Lrp/AsnC family transcriptional regulator [Candidatus Nitrosocosmicus sp.]|nr:Lrp/AsnC family transcriptional regulator [Candidatus Nitrosocosmicus sp.]